MVVVVVMVMVVSVRARVRAGALHALLAAPVSAIIDASPPKTNGRHVSSAAT